jgi:hypothetical protein
VLFLAKGLSSPVPILVDTALYTVSLCISKYHLMTASDETHDLITSMIQLMDQSSILVRRVFFVLRAMIGQGDLFLLAWFDDIYRFPVEAIKRPDALETGIFAESHQIISVLVKNAPDGRAETVAGILTEAVRALQPMDPFQVQQGKLQVIIACFFRFGDRLGHFGFIVVKLLFEVLGNRNADIWDDALYALILVISQLKSQTADVYDSRQLRELLDIAISSGSPGIIANTVYALSKFYESIVGENVENGPAIDLLANLPVMFDLIVNCLQGDLFGEMFYPTLLISLADIVSACRHHITATDRERLFGVYWRFFNEIRTGAMGGDEVKHANSMFSAIFRGFGAILDTYQTLGREDPLLLHKGIMRGYMVEPPMRFLALGTFTDPAMLSFCGFLRKFEQVYGKKGNILMNRNVNYQIVLYGMSMENRRVAETAKDIFEMMRKS